MLIYDRVRVYKCDSFHVVFFSLLVFPLPYLQSPSLQFGHLLTPTQPASCISTIQQPSTMQPVQHPRSVRHLFQTALAA